LLALLALLALLLLVPLLLLLLLLPGPPLVSLAVSIPLLYLPPVRVWVEWIGRRVSAR
jgi:hypothetical protein